MRKYIVVLSFFFVLSGVASIARADAVDGSRMRFNLTEDGGNYIQMVTWHQFWARYTQMNPGTLVNGKERYHQFDPGIRRSRLMLFGRLADRMTLVFHFGINDQTFNNARKPQLYVHDVNMDFDILPRMLSIGVGLHYWNGISRMTNWSTIKLMSLDAPISNWPTIDKTDQFARQMGIYFKGKLSKLDYRFALNRPFQTGNPDLYSLNTGIDYNGTNGSPAFTGYLMHQFWNQEANMLPYLPGTYIGEKSILNIGAGFYYHPRQMRERRRRDGATFNPAYPSTYDDTLYDGLVLASDIFLDVSIGEDAAGGALTAYIAYYYLDFGPRYIRTVGIMNIGTPHPDNSSLNGPGNAFAVIGTGHQVYMQLGYLLPFSPQGTEFQPYVTIQVSSFEARHETFVTPEVGLNWYLHGHNAKVTARYRARPTFLSTAAIRKVVDTYKNEVTLQAQLSY